MRARLTKLTAALAALAALAVGGATLAVVPGKAGEVELVNENGSVVYGVEVTKAVGSQFDVKVDAGNAAVLHQEADDAGEEAEQSEAEEGTSEQAESGEQADR